MLCNQKGSFLMSLQLLIIGLVMMLALSGCGGGSNNPGSPIGGSLAEHIVAPAATDTNINNWLDDHYAYRDTRVAARDAQMPVVISFTLETDGKLPSGDTLQRAIERTDAETGGYAAYFMINCAHPTHFERELKNGGAWTQRIRGLRANASKRSHAELDESTDLDAGNPVELGHEYRALGTLLPKLRVVGGCCGTDHRHVAAIGNYFRPVDSSNYL